MGSVGDLWAVSGWWIGIAGFIIGLGGFIYGIWARSHPKKTAMKVRVKQRALGIPNDPKLEVLYDGKKLERPTLVEVTIDHLGGPEIATAEMPADAIAVRAETPVIVGGLGRTDSYATLDAAGGSIAVKPYLVREWSSRRLLYLAEGRAAYEVQVNMANVGTAKGSWYERTSVTLPILGTTSLLVLGGTVLLWTVGAADKGWALAAMLTGWALLFIYYFAVIAHNGSIERRRKRAALGETTSDAGDADSNGAS